MDNNLQGVSPGIIILALAIAIPLTFALTGLIHWLIKVTNFDGLNDDE